MSKAIKPEDLGAVIEQELTLYSDNVLDRVRAAVKKAAADLVKRTKSTAPVGYRGAFKKGIAAKDTTVKRQAPSYTWYVKAPHGRLTHLLVRGHATKDGGRTKANPFLQKALDEVLPAFERDVEEAVKR